MNKFDEELYTKKNWYSQTYGLLGSEWLLQTLNKLSMIKKIDLKEYTFVNLSANAGYYEYETYCKHILHYKFNPTYYIGDEYAEKINHVLSHRSFHYISENILAEDYDGKKILANGGADVILDCKGALWYALRGLEYDKKKIFNHSRIEVETYKNDLSKLLKNYYRLLKDTGVLLIDCYGILNTMNQALWEIKGLRAKKFCEYSTYTYLRQIYPQKTLAKTVTRLNINTKDKLHPLSNKMDIAYITKKNIEQLIIAIDKDISNRAIILAQTVNLL